VPRSGFVAIVGYPNAGKSTLMNRLVGEKLAITSPKPQTTRTRVLGIRTTAGVQMVFVDTPGLLEPEYALHERMRATSLRALDDADVIVHVIDAVRSEPATLQTVANLKQPPRAPVITALNKIDALDGGARERLAAANPDACLISAVTGDGIDALVDRISAALPEGPFHYPEDELATQPLRFFAAELIREVALEQLEDEIPYAVACEILWVKVAPRWRREPGALDRLGYRLPE
jgi:GTP-binding protein Era